MIDPCSCGEPHPHVVARRRTVDAIQIDAWSDGRITEARSGLYLPGVKPIPIAALWDLLEWVSIYTRAELEVLVDEVRRFARTVAGRRANNLGELAVASGRAILARRARTARYRADASAGIIPWENPVPEMVQARREHIQNCRAIHCRRCGLGR